MHYPTIHAPRTFGALPTSQLPGHLAAAVVTLAALYGLGTHHVLLVAAGLVALLLFHHRLRLSAEQPDPNPGDGQPHTDGGSFRTPARHAAPSTGPRVVDGGTSRRNWRAEPDRRSDARWW